MRLFDAGARVRRIAKLCRDEELGGVTLHDRKVLEWLEKLDDWTLRSEAEAALQVSRHQGRRQARASSTKSAK
jgi:hypothetical protein